MKNRRLAIFIAPIFIGLIVVGFLNQFFIRSKSEGISIPLVEKHRGVCWVGGRQIINSSHIDRIAKHNVNWISQTPFGWQSGFDNPQIGTNRNVERKGYQAWWGERDDGLRETTRLAKEKGIKTILKPHIWLRDVQGKWRGEIEMKSEEDWKEWFKNYEEFILHYAKVAEEEGIEMLCIGTELHKTCTEREENWRALIAKIREVYSGDLTYAANFSGEYQEVSFWDELDYIGVQAYFSLTNKEEASLEELKAGWEKPIDELKRYSQKFNKPVLFTEVGYKSTKDSGKTPWEWPQRISREDRELIHSVEHQADLYEALFTEVFDQPFIAGVHLWKWFPTYEDDQSSYRSRAFDIDFSPQGKPAEAVMSKWYKQFAQ